MSEESIVNLSNNFSAEKTIPQGYPVGDFPDLKISMECNNLNEFVEELKAFLVKKKDGEDIKFSIEEIADLLSTYKLGSLEKKYTGEVTFTVNFEVNAISEDEAKRIIEENISIDNSDDNLSIKGEEITIEIDKE